MSGAGDVVAGTISALLVVVTPAGGGEGGALQNAETAGVPVTETVFTGVSVPISTDTAEANSGETVGAVTLVFRSTGGDRVGSTAGDELVDAAEASHMAGHGVESVCAVLTADGTDARVDCAEAVERLTAGAQVRGAEEEMDACCNEVVAAAAEIRVSAGGQDGAAEAGGLAVEDTSSPLSTGVEVIAAAC